ncbi:MAG: 50S ribosomal protein L9 [Candidatus Omnitrophica bacterium]|nr:50S ribosomal protein L9 [Candidatus Omnitrophota bacterium]MDD5080418.1 50S ribosomal protein L9 [Candidatus Omnitrophota bacterium]MDD5441098.1 50S ribosomal protein L9 [Candidatus Omnitrophota bacterium]
MKVILLKDIKRVGKESEVVEVKNGYGRNYLLPNGLAVVAGKNAERQIQEVQKRNAKQLERQKDTLTAVKAKIEALSLNIEVEAKDDETLYGSVSEHQIIQTAADNGVDLSKLKIDLDAPIKKLGVYKVNVSLGCGIDASLRIWVVKK